MKQRIISVLKLLPAAVFMAAASAYLTLAVMLGYPPSAHEPFIRAGCTLALLACGAGLVFAGFLHRRAGWASLLVPLIFCITLVVYDSAQASEGAQHKPHIYDHAGAPVDPLCFLSNFGTEDAPIYPTQNCEWEGLVSVADAPPLEPERFVSTYYEDHYYDPETEETHVSRGFVGYRAIGQVAVDGGSYLALHLVENGGGSGTFSSLMLLDMKYDEENSQRVFPLYRGVAFGDRCMGGIADARLEDGELVFALNTTMADIFNLTGEPEREILQSEAYKALPYCAACCYGVAEFDLEGFRSIEFIPNRMKPEAENEAAACVEKMVKLNEDYGQHVFSAEDFGFFVRELEHTCLGRMEGK